MHAKSGRQEPLNSSVLFWTFPTWITRTTSPGRAGSSQLTLTQPSHSPAVPQLATDRPSRPPEIRWPRLLTLSFRIVCFMSITNWNDTFYLESKCHIFPWILFQTTWMKWSHPPLCFCNRLLFNFFFPVMKSIEVKSPTYHSIALFTFNRTSFCCYFGVFYGKVGECIDSHEGKPKKK